MMGGKIQIESKPGKGTKFSFNIKLQRMDKTTPLFVPSPELHLMPVLVINSSPAGTQFLKSMLLSFHFRVQTTSDTVQGLAAIENLPQGKLPGLILLDINSPNEAAGLAFIKSIRQKPDLTGIPIILLVNTKQALDKSISANADHVLIKPTTRSNLFDAIMQSLGQKAYIEKHKKTTPLSNPLLSSLHGKHILLVEDNYINQLVGVEMLENMKIVASVASSGEQALQMLEHNEFDAVLMDIQMPGMDGYETTARIRNDPRFTYNKLPVIAMTAHAMTGERQKALEAGLNDYVSKPVDVIQLSNTLLRWLDPDLEAPLTSASQIILPEVLLPAEIRKTLNTKTALSRLGSLSLYKRLLSLFSDENAGKISEIRLAIENSEIKTAHRLAHTLKSAAATIGAESLSRAARKMESALVSKKPADFEKLLLETEAQMNPVLSALEALESTPPAAAKNPPNEQAFGALLQKLADLLDDNDAESVSVMEKMLAMYGTSDRQNELKKLQKLVRKYDFTGALTYLHKLATTWRILLKKQEKI
jgi:two-component system, sensor histidine kinase and response regulator